ncbi:MAG: C-type lectin domain-containing protein [Emcibacter sp.]|nr:C-type lectin domain-containing protein [Emcibacter sp.]
MNNLKVILIFGLLFAVWNIPPSAAEVGRKTHNLDGTISAGPYYNPASKSYFELFRMQKKPGSQSRWFGAKALAEKQFFKGTRGRLAIIKDLDTHQFLLRNFSAKNYWIGLQYFCNTQTLKWVDGTDATRSKFTAWDTDWANTHIRCANMDYMPVHYTTATSTKALRWRASGPNKGYALFLVEYPTGKK